MRTRPSVPFVAMCMEQMELTCTKGDVPNVRKGLRGSNTGGFPTGKCITNRVATPIHVTGWAEDL